MRILLLRISSHGGHVDVVISGSGYVEDLGSSSLRTQIADDDLPSARALKLSTMQSCVTWMVVSDQSGTVIQAVSPQGWYSIFVGAQAGGQRRHDATPAIYEWMGVDAGRNIRVIDRYWNAGVGGRRDIAERSCQFGIEMEERGCVILLPEGYI